jgi:hypothetical protein
MFIVAIPQRGRLFGKRFNPAYAIGSSKLHKSQGAGCCVAARKMLGVTNRTPLLALETSEDTLPGKAFQAPEREAHEPVNSNAVADEVPITSSELELPADSDALEEKQLLLLLKKQLGADFERIFDSKNPFIGEVF